MRICSLFSLRHRSTISPWFFVFLMGYFGEERSFIREYTTNREDGTTQVIKSFSLTQVFPCQKRIRLGANPVLQKHFTLRWCKIHPKKHTLPFKWLKKILNLLGSSFTNIKSSAQSNSDRFLFQSISITLFSNEDKTISITILKTKLEIKGKGGNCDEQHFLL